MNRKYFYIHGLNSTGERTSKALSEVLETNIINLDWNSIDFCQNNLKYLESQIHKTLESDEPYIIIGTSLGGLYANILANKLDVPCALFNPVINPRKTFDIVKDIEYFSNIKESLPFLIKGYENALKETKFELLPRLIVLGLQDDIVDPQETIKLWKGKCQIITVNEGHRIQDFKPFKEAILSLFNDVLY